MYIIGHVRQQIASQSKCSADDKCLTEADGKKVNTVKNILMQKQESWKIRKILNCKLRRRKVWYFEINMKLGKKKKNEKKNAQ